MKKDLGYAYISKSGREYNVVRNKRSRAKIRMTYRDGAFIVSAGIYVSDKTVENFIEKNDAWAEKQQIKGKALKRSGDSFYYCGKEYVFKKEYGKKLCVKFDGDVMTAYSPRQTDTDEVMAYLAKERLPFFLERMNYFTDKYPCGEKPKLRFRAMKSLWGVYHTQKNYITLNTYLVQGTERQQEMILFHELCHREELNHSKRFYALLKREYPDCAELKKGLNSWAVKSRV